MRIRSRRDIYISETFHDRLLKMCLPHTCIGRAARQALRSRVGFSCELIVCEHKTSIIYLYSHSIIFTIAYVHHSFIALCVVGAMGPIWYPRAAALHVKPTHKRQDTHALILKLVHEHVHVSTHAHVFYPTKVGK